MMKVYIVGVEKIEKGIIFFAPIGRNTLFGDFSTYTPTPAR